MEQIFHPFPRLPTELRLKIWRFAQPLFPRVIRIRHELSDLQTDTPGVDRPITTIPWLVASSEIPTPLLLVNRDSREGFL
jgi:hypothetical protein